MAYCLRYAVLDGTHEFLVEFSRMLITLLLVGQGYGARTEAAEMAALNDRHLVTIDPRTFAISRRSPTW